MVQKIGPGEKNTRLGILLRKILFSLNYAGISDFQKKNNLNVDGIFNLVEYQLLQKQLLEPQELDFQGEYISVPRNKDQIVINQVDCHTSPKQVFDIWDKNKFKSPPSIIIDRNGGFFRGYDESFWAHTVTSGRSEDLWRSQCSIHVSLCNWGVVQQRIDSKYYTKVDEFGKNGPGKTIQSSDVCYLEEGYKGYFKFQEYTDIQIKKLESWILMMSLRFDIELLYRSDRIWAYTEDVFRGIPGIYSNNSFDEFSEGEIGLYPSTKLIKMLEGLKKYETE